ncbi:MULTISPECIES: hypothetical protein [Streptomyces]|uniref:hypothetical protein n=1 Tax=Streptomyces TaxID=1883 RepID=UPI0006892E66|nr:MULTISPECIES: hypothetical protein [Streptomyces]
MNTAVRAWLIGQLGPNSDPADLDARYTRLGTARAVALEVLSERHAALLAQPATVNVSAVVSISTAENIKALERKITELRAGIPLAPDEDDPDGDGTALNSGPRIVQLTARPRR